MAKRRRRKNGSSPTKSSTQQQSEGVREVVSVGARRQRPSIYNGVFDFFGFFLVLYFIYSASRLGFVDEGLRQADRSLEPFKDPDALNRRNQLLEANTKLITAVWTDVARVTSDGNIEPVIVATCLSDVDQNPELRPWYRNEHEPWLVDCFRAYFTEAARSPSLSDQRLSNAKAILDKAHETLQGVVFDPMVKYVVDQARSSEDIEKYLAATSVVMGMVDSYYSRPFMILPKNVELKELLHAFVPLIVSRESGGIVLTASTLCMLVLMHKIMSRQHVKVLSWGFNFGMAGVTGYMLHQCQSEAPSPTAFRLLFALMTMTASQAIYNTSGYVYKLSRILLAQVPALLHNAPYKKSVKLLMKQAQKLGFTARHAIAYNTGYTMDGVRVDMAAGVGMKLESLKVNRTTRKGWSKYFHCDVLRTVSHRAAQTRMPCRISSTIVANDFYVHIKSMPGDITDVAVLLLVVLQKYARYLAVLSAVESICKSKASVFVLPSVSSQELFEQRQVVLRIKDGSEQAFAELKDRFTECFSGISLSEVAGDDKAGSSISWQINGLNVDWAKVDAFKQSCRDYWKRIRDTEKAELAEEAQRAVPSYVRQRPDVYPRPRFKPQDLEYRGAVAGEASQVVPQVQQEYPDHVMFACAGEILRASRIPGVRPGNPVPLYLACLAAAQAAVSNNKRASDTLERLLQEPPRIGATTFARVKKSSNFYKSTETKDFKPDYKIRLYRAESTRLAGRVHEHTADNGQEVGVLVIERMGGSH